MKCIFRKYLNFEHFKHLKQPIDCVNDVWPIWMIRRRFLGPLAGVIRVRKANSIRFEFLSAESSNWMQMRRLK